MGSIEENKKKGVGWENLGGGCKERERKRERKEGDKMKIRKRDTKEKLRILFTTSLVLYYGSIACIKTFSHRIPEKEKQLTIYVSNIIIT